MPFVVVVDTSAAVATAVTLFGAFEGTKGIADQGTGRDPVTAADNTANEGATDRTSDRSLCDSTDISIIGY